MTEAASRTLALQSSEPRSSEVPCWILIAAIFVAAVAVTLRVSFDGALWYAQAVDVIAAPMTLLAVVLGMALPGVGDIGIRAVAWISAQRFSFSFVALMALPLIAAGTVFVVGMIPIAADELVPIWQARLFASFEVVAHYEQALIDAVIPPVSQGVFVLVSPQGEAMSVYWPGQALLLTPLVWLGVPWLIGPLFGALAIYFIGRLTSALVDRWTGVVAMVLAVASGQFLLMAMTPFPEGVHLALSAAFVWLIVLGRPQHFFLAGLVGGLALALKNPFPHFVFAMPWVIWLLMSPARRRNVLPLFLGYLPWLVMIAAWVALQSQLAPPSVQDEGGFWVSKLSQLIQPPSGLILVVRLVELLSAWSWSAPGLLVLAAIGWTRTTDVRLRLLGASFVATVAGYLFFPDQQGLGYGARYFHPAWVALPILGAAALSMLRSPKVERLTFAACLLGLVLVLPAQLFYAHLLQQRQAAPTRALAAPGVDLYFVLFRGENGVSETVLANDLSGSGDVVLVSQGEARDQMVVDMLFPGSRLVTENEWGRGYARP